METLETAIRRHLVSYLAGDATLDVFTDWLVGASWNIENKGDPDAAQLAYSIELALAEASSGLRSLDELRAELRDISQHVSLNFSTQGQEGGSNDVRVLSGSGVKTINLRSLQSVQDLLPQSHRIRSLVGTRFVVVS